jgi:TonB family protein
VLRPVILVPSVFEQLSANDRSAVLCHEMAHIEGFDFLLRGLTEIARALIWFQPLMWIVRRRLREVQEMACDDRVLAAGGRPSAYAKLLLDWDVRAGAGALAAVGMAHRSCLKRRLDALLAQGLHREPAAGTGVFAAWLLGLAVALPLAALSITQASPFPALPTPVWAGMEPPVLPAPIPATHKRPVVVAQVRPAPVPTPAPLPVVSAPLVHFVANTSLVIVDVTAKDQSGKAIEGLKASDFGLTEDGKPQPIKIFEYITFDFQTRDGAAQGVSSYYVLGYYSANSKLDGAYRTIGIALPGNTAAKLDYRAGYYGANSAVPAFTVDGVTDMHTGADFTAPTVLSKWDPEYSEQARKSKYSGTVSLVIDIDVSGQVTGVRVVRSLGMGLDEKATEAAMRWKFRPGRSNGEPVATQAQVDMNFRLL